MDRLTDGGGRTSVADGTGPADAAEPTAAGDDAARIEHRPQPDPGGDGQLVRLAPGPLGPAPGRGVVRRIGLGRDGRNRRRPPFALDRTYALRLPRAGRQPLWLICAVTAQEELGRGLIQVDFRFASHVLGAEAA